MEIVSLNFLLFTLAVIVVYFTLNRQAQNVWLIIASAFFIGTHGWQNLLPLAVISAVTWATGKKLYETQDIRWLVTGIAVNAGSLLFLRTAASKFVNPAGTVDHLLIPLGFSFYTLQAISYLLDVYHGRIKAQAGFLDVTLFLMFFPKMLSGPIERAGHFLPQLNSDRTVDNQKASRGLTYILFGLVRKVALAEVLLTFIPKNFILTPIIDASMAAGMAPIHVATYVAPVSNVDRLLGLICYGIYLYNDFAGYTLIMRGISVMMGFDLSPNFREPFFSTTLSEFWSRWHISLSSWLRDYLFYPLTRWLRKRSISQLLVVPVAIPLITTMLAAGLWHGLTIPFLVWGSAYGVIMTLEQLAFQKWPALRPQSRSRLYRGVACLVTFCIVSLVWVPFAASSWREIAAFPAFLAQRSLWAIEPSFSLWAVILAASSFLLDLVQAFYRDELSDIPSPLLVRAAVLAAAFILLFLAFMWTSPFTSNVFIYQAF